MYFSMCASRALPCNLPFSGKVKGALYLCFCWASTSSIIPFVTSGPILGKVIDGDFELALLDSLSLFDGADMLGCPGLAMLGTTKRDVGMFAVDFMLLLLAALGVFFFMGTTFGPPMLPDESLPLAGRRLGCLVTEELAATAFPVIFPGGSLFLFIFGTRDKNFFRGAPLTLFDDIAVIFGTATTLGCGAFATTGLFSPLVSPLGPEVVDRDARFLIAFFGTETSFFKGRTGAPLPTLTVAFANSCALLDCCCASCGSSCCRPKIPKAEDVRRGDGASPTEPLVAPGAS
mmetsp:Transcript_26523/g.32089  ORF Transcript_26523/g.32089 Transcript_26523/m.32089 type:complete len:289 (-) Transcript_26523:927-1793(-)